MLNFKPDILSSGMVSTGHLFCSFLLTVGVLRSCILDVYQSMHKSLLAALHPPEKTNTPHDKPQDSWSHCHNLYVFLNLKVSGTYSTTVEWVWFSRMGIERRLEVHSLKRATRK
jgi:hypothetical protein